MCSAAFIRGWYTRQAICPTCAATKSYRLAQLQHSSADTILLIKKLCFENCGVGTTNLFGVVDLRFVCGNV